MIKKLNLLALAALLLSGPGCNEELADSKPIDRYNPEIYIQKAEAMLAENAEEFEFRGPSVIIPDGSVNVLQAAVDQVGRGGAITLAPGTHTEDETITITNRVRISGQPGAVLVSGTPNPFGFPSVANPAFHILGANQVVIEGLTIRNVIDVGPTAILIEGGNQTRIRNNTIQAFEFGVAQYGGDDTRIYDNTITGVVSFIGCGIVNIKGTNMKIYDNVFSENFLEIFVGDANGLIKGNHMSSNSYMGVLLCKPKIFDVYLVLPSGQVAAADVSANHWLVLQNFSENHIWNYLVLDGANNNTLVQNDARNAGLADIELAGDSYRNGFFTPYSFENLVISAGYPDITIKVCGVDNEAYRGTLIDTDLFPCD
ncbi:MAG TPA: right-handed parallel beta-helix repeat-containing protein [Flavilitoribacter sp.]|nr:right-handed parallel beta-helix repeat-containing protein [Flavilitoribacter sp.]